MKFLVYSQRNGAEYLILIGAMRIPITHSKTRLTEAQLSYSRNMNIYINVRMCVCV